MENEKNATIKIELKADSGYKSGINGRISAFQWGLINKVLGNEKNVPQYSNQNMIDFGVFCMIEVKQEDGTVSDFFERFIKERINNV
jgi:hypothetical protein